MDIQDFTGARCKITSKSNGTTPVYLNFDRDSTVFTCATASTAYTFTAGTELAATANKYNGRKYKAITGTAANINWSTIIGTYSVGRVIVSNEAGFPSAPANPDTFQLEADYDASDKFLCILPGITLSDGSTADVARCEVTQGGIITHVFPVPGAGLVGPLPIRKIDLSLGAPQLKFIRVVSATPGTPTSFSNGCEYSVYYISG